MVRRTVAAALLGNLLAVIIAVGAVCSASLAQQGLSAPTLQSSLNYLLLAVVYLGLHVRKQGWRLKARWWAYAILAFLDVEGNFLLVMAYRYTSLTSVTLLDSFTIPMVVCLSAGLLGAIYRRGHYLGFSLCLGGLLVLVVTDRSTAGSGGGGQKQEASNPLLGDALVLLGATLYALCNVLQEWLLGDVHVHELLGMLGLFGGIWSAAQGLPLELGTLRNADWDASVLLPFLGFGLAMFSFYSLVPFELKWGGAALLNICLLSSDLWSALARYFFFGGFPGSSFLFFLASLLIVAAGIFVFTWSGDVETRLGADSATAAGGGLPVQYHQVPGAERQPPAAFSGKDAHQALQEVQRQQQGQQAQQVLRHPAANPFDIGTAARRSDEGGFLPLSAAEDPLPLRTAAAVAAAPAPAAASAPVAGRSPSTPTALRVALPPGTAVTGDLGLTARSSLDF
ncbi:Solute carrier family 35 member F2 [Chlorella vulgaris]